MRTVNILAGSVMGCVSTDVIFDSFKLIRNDLDNNNLAPQLDNINITFLIGIVNFETESVGYSVKYNTIRVTLTIPVEKIKELIKTESYNAAVNYAYNRFLKGLSKINLKCKSWANPAPRKLKAKKIKEFKIE